MLDVCPHSKSPHILGWWWLVAVAIATALLVIVSGTKTHVQEPG